MKIGSPWSVTFSCQPR